MDTSSVPLKQCSRKDKCVNPLGSWLPATTEYFYRRLKAKDGLYPSCRACCSVDNHVHYLENSAEICQCVKEYRQSHAEEKRRSDRLYREKNADKLKAYGEAYRATHRGQLRLKDQRYHENNKAAQSEKNRTYRNLHKDERKEYDRIRYLKHGAEIRERLRMFHLANPEIARSAARRRKALKRAAVGTHSRQDIRELMVSQNACCWWCGVKIHGNKYHVDHRIPLSRGGTNAPENLCIACPKCNLSKGAKLPHEWSDRLL